MTQTYVKGPKTPQDAARRGSPTLDAVTGAALRPAVPGATFAAPLHRVLRSRPRNAVLGAKSGARSTQYYHGVVKLSARNDERNYSELRSKREEYRGWQFCVGND